MSSCGRSCTKFLPPTVGASRISLAITPTLGVSVVICNYMRTYNTLIIWTWARSLVQHALPDQFKNMSIQIQHALMAAPLNVHPQSPTMWWELLRGACYWLLWKARCTLVMEQRRSTPRSIIEKIWHRLHLYLYQEWNKLQIMVGVNKIDSTKTRSIFSRQFRQDPIIYHFEGEALVVALSPPHPPQVIQHGGRWFGSCPLMANGGPFTIPTLTPLSCVS